jgi:hypothetical protein
MRRKRGNKNVRPFTLHHPLRQFPGLENLSDDQADQAQKALKELSVVLFQVLNNREIVDHENK